MNTMPLMPIIARPAAALVAAVLAGLAGCSGLPRHFENRLTTTLAGDRAFVTSLWGPVGITTEISAADAAELAKLRRQAAAAAAAAAPK